MPYYLDLVLRVGRLLGTLRALINQSEDLIDFIKVSDDIVHELDTGQEL